MGGWHRGSAKQRRSRGGSGEMGFRAGLMKWLPSGPDGKHFKKISPPDILLKMISVLQESF